MEGRDSIRSNTIADEPQGGSKHHHYKRKRVNKELFSWLRTGTGRRQVKRKRFKKKEHASKRVQRGSTDASSQGEMSRSTKPYQVKDPYASTMRKRGCRTEEYHEAMKRSFARLALKCCQNSQSVEFEVEEILHYQLGFLNECGTPPENYRVWIHLSFTALPKNADRNVVTPIHFFAELSYRVGGFPYEVKTCSAFEPRNDIEPVDSFCHLNGWDIQVITLPTQMKV